MNPTVFQMNKDIDTRRKKLMQITSEHSTECTPSSGGREGGRRTVNKLNAYSRLVFQQPASFSRRGVGKSSTDGAFLKLF